MNSAFYFVFKQPKRTKGEGERWGEKSSYTIWSNSSRYVPNEVSSREYAGLFLISFPCEFISPEMIECIPSLFICFPFFLIHRRGIFISGQIMSIHSVLCARFIHKLLVFCILLLHFAIQFLSVFVFIIPQIDAVRSVECIHRNVKWTYTISISLIFIHVHLSFRKTVPFVASNSDSNQCTF